MAGHRRRAVLVGTGGLATATADSLALVGGELDIVVVGRSAEAAERVRRVASARAAALGSPIRFTSHVDPLTSDRPDLWGGRRPDLVILLASTQSPWEAQRHPSAWTELVRAGGFGITLLFQHDLARRVAKWAAEANVPLVNGCLPDLVNPLLAAQGAPVLTGIGNGATIRSFVRAELGHDGVRVLAHHYHLHEPEPGVADAWVQTDQGEDVSSTTLLGGLRATPRTELNRVTGLATAQVIRALTDRSRSLRTTLPGVGGRQGGLPVQISDGQIQADLGTSWTDHAVRAANEAWSLADGAAVDERGTITFAPSAVESLSAYLDDMPSAVPASDLPELATRIYQLRDTLRTRPPGDAP